MKIWFTRPSTWDLVVRGVDRCQLWLQKPFFDTTPRGKERDRRLHYLPIGWRVVHPIHGDISFEVSVTVGEAMPTGRYEPVVDALWDALCRSVDGKGPQEGGQAPNRWVDRVDTDATNEAEERTRASFLFEYDAPPQLWFDAAMANGAQYQTAAGRWAQKFFPLDDELGVESDELEPIANPSLLYEGSRIVVAA